MRRTSAESPATTAAWILVKYCDEMCSGTTVTAGVAAVNCWAIFSQMAFSSIEPKSEKRRVPLTAAGLPASPAVPGAGAPQAAWDNPAPRMGVLARLLSTMRRDRAPSWSLAKVAMLFIFLSPMAKAATRLVRGAKPAGWPRWRVALRGRMTVSERTYPGGPPS
jgi:hypothetical protein